jgi:hypothetical protein
MSATTQEGGAVTDERPIEDPDTSSWKVYSPVPFRGCCASKFMGREEADQVEQPLRKVRCFWWVLVLALYLPMYLARQIDTDVTSAVHAESLSEFFPDAMDAVERLKYSEVSPGVGEEMHADDIAQTLNWYTTFCKTQKGADALIKDTWDCELNWVNIGPANPQRRWDAAQNRGLNRRDNPSGKKPDPAYVQQSIESIDNLCSKNFLTAHVGIGDDPVEVADFGDMHAFQRNVLNSDNISRLSQDYDEFTILDHDGMFKSMREQLDKGWGLKHKLDNLQNGLNEIRTTLDGLSKPSSLVEEAEETRSPRKWGTARMQRRLGPEVMAALDEEEEHPLPTRDHALPLPAASARHSRPWIPAGLAQRKARARVEGVGAPEFDSDEDLYGQDCFGRYDVARFVQLEWEKRKRNVSYGNTTNRTFSMLTAIYPTISDAEKRGAVKEMDHDKSGDISFPEFLAYVRDNPDGLDLPGRGALLSKCRNHHWGLLTLCKPTTVSAYFRIKNLERTINGTGPKGIYTKVKSLVHVHIHFAALGEAQNSGWYKTNIDIRTEPVFGVQATWYLLTMNIFLLFMLFLCWDPFLSLLLLPYSTWKVLTYRLRPGLSQKEASLRTYHRMCRLLDARLTRVFYLDPVWVIVENIIAFSFAWAVYESVRLSLLPTIPPADGNDSSACRSAFFEEELARQSRGKLDLSPTQISPITHLMKCTNLPPLQTFIEVEWVVIFGGQVGSLVVAMIWLRCFAFLDFLHRLRWLPATLRLCRNKLMNFIFVYVLLVAGFSVAMFIRFGGLYVQYSTFTQAFFVLLMFSFGHTERAVEDLHPWIETTGTEIAALLLLFQIMVVAIALQFFTTIVLDGYIQSQTPDKYEDLIEADFEDHILTFVRFFGHMPERDSQILTYSEDHVKRASISEQLQQKQEAAPAPHMSEVG